MKCRSAEIFIFSPTYLKIMVKSEGRNPFSTAMLCIFALAMLFNFMGCEPGIVEPPTTGPTTDSTAYFAFRHAVTTPPSTYRGPVFELRHDYPQTLPAGGANMP